MRVGLHLRGEVHRTVVHDGLRFPIRVRDHRAIDVVVGVLPDVKTASEVHPPATREVTLTVISYSVEPAVSEGRTVRVPVPIPLPPNEGPAAGGSPYCSPTSFRIWRTLRLSCEDGAAGLVCCSRLFGGKQCSDKFIQIRGACSDSVAALAPSTSREVKVHAEVGTRCAGWESPPILKATPPEPRVTCGRLPPHKYIALRGVPPAEECPPREARKIKRPIPAHRAVTSDEGRLGGSNSSAGER